MLWFVTYIAFTYLIYHCADWFQSSHPIVHSLIKCMQLHANRIGALPFWARSGAHPQGRFVLSRIYRAASCGRGETLQCHGVGAVSHRSGYFRPEICFRRGTPSLLPTTSYQFNILRQYPDTIDLEQANGYFWHRIALRSH